MHIEERTYYEDKVKMEAQWVVVFVLISSITTLTIALTMMLQEKPTNWLEIGIVSGMIILSDSMIVVLFRNMNISLAFTKKTFYYKMSPLGKLKLLPWTEVIKIRSYKIKSTSYGKGYKRKYGTTYIMNSKPGIELELLTGKKIFFSVSDAEEFKRSVRKLELPILIE